MLYKEEKSAWRQNQRRMRLKWMDDLRCIPLFAATTTAVVAYYHHVDYHQLEGRSFTPHRMLSLYGVCRSSWVLFSVVSWLLLLLVWVCFCDVYIVLLMVLFELLICVDSYLVVLLYRHHENIVGVIGDVVNSFRIVDLVDVNFLVVVSAFVVVLKDEIRGITTWQLIINISHHCCLTCNVIIQCIVLILLSFDSC